MPAACYSDSSPSPPHPQISLLIALFHVILFYMVCGHLMTGSRSKFEILSSNVLISLGGCCQDGVITFAWRKTTEDLFPLKHTRRKHNGSSLQWKCTRLPYHVEVTVIYLYTQRYFVDMEVKLSAIYAYWEERGYEVAIGSRSQLKSTSLFYWEEIQILFSLAGEGSLSNWLGLASAPWGRGMQILCDSLLERFQTNLPISGVILLR